MPKPYYECHITMIGDPFRLKPMVEAIGWKFSAIDGDPALGNGIKCYATYFYNTKQDFHRVLAELNMFASRLSGLGAQVIRRKIEHVIYDDRSDLCVGECAECHEARRN